jgi:uncharacterized hydrophobic protein (TIGR00341 family)
MKKIIINIRNEEYPKIEPLIDKHHFSRTYKEGIMEIRLYLPDAELDKFIKEIQELMDLRYKDNLVEVSSPQFVISPYLKREEEKVEKPVQKAPIEELVASTQKYTTFEWGSPAITTIAGLVALTGLFLNNSAIIIGAMILSPILGPIIAFAILIAVGKTPEALRSLGILALLLGAVIFFSALSTVVISLYTTPPLTAEILNRTEVNPIYIAMAVLLGVATILAISQNISELIAGVAVAAALIPPTVVVGIMLILDPAAAFRSFVLVLENVVGLLAGALVATLVLRVAPRTSGERSMARRITLRVSFVFAILIIILFILSLILP